METTFTIPEGFELRNLRRMMQFAEKFPNIKIVSPLATKLSWSHFIEILILNDPLQCEFYLTMCSTEMWSTKRLRKGLELSKALMDNAENTK